MNFQCTLRDVSAQAFQPRAHPSDAEGAWCCQRGVLTSAPTAPLAATGEGAFLGPGNLQSVCFASESPDACQKATLVVPSPETLIQELYGAPQLMFSKHPQLMDASDL